MSTFHRILCLALFLCPSIVFAQEEVAMIAGAVKSASNESLPGVTLTLEGTSKGTVTNAEGYFEMKDIKPGRYSLTVRCIGYLPQSKEVFLEAGQSLDLKIELQADILRLDEITILSGVEATEAVKTERTGFHVEVAEMEKFTNQSVDINSVLDHMAGVRVKRSGGLGSDFVYSLDGMSGNSIRFLVDGIPIDFFGSVYNINNFPVSLIERIEVYKGVVPVYLAADALGGAINIITKTNQSDFLEANYSYGSFNTHQAALRGQWSDSTSGFTTRLTAFYNYSDNDYKVWGKGVTYYDASARVVEFTKENPATRFNDQYRAACLKLDIGFSGRTWADQFFIGFLTSDVDQGVQHGQTMAYPYGDMRYTERFYMPSITYHKKDLFTKGLDLKFFSSYGETSGVSIDTSTANYNWRGDVVSIDLDGGERRNQKSLFHLWDKALMTSLNTTYSINDHFEVVFNYLYKGVRRTGADDFTPYHTVPFTEPQSLKTSFAGLSLNSNFFQRRLKTEIFVKHYGYKASVTEENFTTDETDQNVIEVANKQSNLGGGIAGSLKIRTKTLLKASLERAIRLPDTREALGNGVNILNSPHIQPEKSLNLNFGASFGKYFIRDNHAFKFNINAFYRDTKDLIYPTISGGRGEITYMNLNKIRGKGGEFELIYDFNSKIEFNYNVTYLDQRNNEEVNEHGIKNIVYRDRLRNAPYLMSNAELNFRLEDLIQKSSQTFIYSRAGYVHEYYLNWPSLGSGENKLIVPSQFVVDAGFSYTFPSSRVAFAFDVGNIFNTQVYDNFLLQKPGRSFAAKVSYRISKI